MLNSIKHLEGCSIGATDGPIGHVEDFYFDDQSWVIRYLVVDAGNWLPGRKVLISPISIGRLDWGQRELGVSLTRAQVKASPDIDTEKPILRQHEKELRVHFGYPVYWGGPGYWAGDMYPNMMLPGYGGFGSPEAIRQQAESDDRRVESEDASSADPHLRSCREVMKYDVHASDGDIGHVEGMLVDDQTWAIRWLIVRTGHWWLGHKVLVAPTWISGASWSDATVSVHLTRRPIKDAPPYDSSTTLSRDQEADTYQHYDRRSYWIEDSDLEAEAASR